MPKVVIELEMENMVIAAITERMLKVQLKTMQKQNPLIQSIKTRIDN